MMSSGLSVVQNSGTLLANATNLTTAGTLTVQLSSFTNVSSATLGVVGTNTVLDITTPGNTPYLVNLGTINLSAGRITNSLVGAGFTITNFFVIAGVGDLSSLRSWAESSRALGFEGMGCIHPAQIPVIHEAFAPSASEIEKASTIVAAFEDAQKRGLGAVSLGSKMIDPPVVKRAQKLVERAKEMGKA